MARKVSPEEFERIINAKMRRIIERGREIVKENGEYGAELVRDTVETSGTVGTGKRGRIDTGDMLRSVSDDYQEAPNGARSVYGFIDNPPDYTIYQEYDEPNPAIEGMYAIDDADMNVQVDFKRDIDRMLREEWGN